MCTNPLHIVNQYNYSHYEVDCRKCDECLYDKSQRYMSMLMAYKSKDRNQLFVTLTYSNGYCPYLLRSELYNFLETGEIPFIYRDYDIYHFVSHGVDKYHYYFDSKVPFQYAQKLDASKIGSLPRLVKYHPSGSLPTFYSDRIGVLDYIDIQKLVKNLRTHFSFDYYCIGEYGSKKELFRPHWHINFYLSKSTCINKFMECVRTYWHRCAPSQIRFLPANHIEQYISQYVTKVSQYPIGLFSLQQRFVRYSRSIGRACAITLSMLTFDLHYYKRDKNGNVLKLLPNQREANVLFPVKKFPNIPLSWFSQFQSCVFPPSKRFYNVARKGRNLSEMYDFAIASSEFHTKLASQRLRDYLEENPTIYTEHKEKCLRANTFPRDYGFRPSHFVRHFLLSYKSEHSKSLEKVKKFKLKSNLNLHFYEHLETS